MAVDPEVSRAVMEHELAAVTALSTQYAWEITIDPGKPLFSVRMRAHNGDEYRLTVECDDYREVPPYFEFLDPVTGEPGTRNAYPAQTKDSFFHSAPCICAPFNRKAYKTDRFPGPHTDWGFGDWARSTANNYAWSNASTLGDMLGIIQTRLLRPEYYGGRAR